MKILVMCLVTFLLLACHTSQRRLTGDNIRLWKETPAWAMAKAVESNDTNKVNRILAKGKIDVDYREPTYGQSLLYWAIWNNKTEMVHFLLSKGANPNLHNRFNGRSPISLSCSYPMTDANILRLLLKYGGNPNDYVANSDTVTNMHSQKTPLTHASSTSLERVKILVEAGADIEMAIVPGKTPLYHAMIMKRFDVAKYLLTECGADHRKTYVVTVQGDTTHFTDLLTEYSFRQTEENESDRKAIREFLENDKK